MGLVKLLLCTVLLSVSISESLARGREGRFFSLFSIVQFENNECQLASDSGLTGTCLTNSECENSSGIKDGSCAAGFGVCCMYRISTCGTSVTKNCTYIQNPEYPAAIATAGSCAYTLTRIDNNICQIRLDFEKLETTLPPTSDGACTDSVTVAAGDGANPPVICGNMNSQHMYVETGSTGSAGSITFNFATAATQSYRIKATYLECGNSAKAPQGCVQYFTGRSGSLSTYNHAGGRLLRNQNYNTCFRREAGFCRIQFSESSTTTPDSFKFSGTADESAVNNCATDFIRVQSTPDLRVICGDILNEIDGMINPGSVLSNVLPFQIQTFTDNSGIADLVGYNLNFVQLPC